MAHWRYMLFRFILSPLFSEHFPWAWFTPFGRAFGIVLTAIVAYFAFGQKIDTAGLIGMALIISGVLVINLFSQTGH